MIEYLITGNIFDSECQTKVVTTNTVGAMGKGVALECAQRYPAVKEHYNTCHRQGTLDIGRLEVCRVDKGQILLFPTKMDWRRPSRLEWIVLGLQELTARHDIFNITSLAVPPLGCGNGQLNYDDVYPVLYQYLNPMPFDVHLYLP